ncbi:MAG: YitT family protein [Intestinimonas sp.]
MPCGSSFRPSCPTSPPYPAIAAVAGALFVGLGVGLVVRIGGACGGDDALALCISHVARWPIARCYLLTDLTVLALSLSIFPPPVFSIPSSPSPSPPP